MSLLNFENTLFCLDFAGTFVFAVSGAHAAVRRQMDIWGMFVLAFVTAVGGGTLRSILMGDYPVPILRTPAPFSLALLATVVVFFASDWIDRIHRPIRLFDAIGLGVFTAVGIAISLDRGLPWWAALLLGCVTATCGGLIRDLLRREIPLILCPGELYATAALGGGLVMLLLHALGSPRPTSMVAGAACVIAIRLGSVYLDWRTHPLQAGNPDRESRRASSTGNRPNR